METIAILFGVLCLVFTLGNLLSGSFSKKKRPEDAALERDMGHVDWVIRGGTHEGYNDQNSTYTAGRDRLRTWKPSK